MYHSFSYYYIDRSHLTELVTALSRVHQWIPLGIYLGLKDSTLLEIHAKNQPINGNALNETCMSEMLAVWLNGPKNKCNKQFLQRALERLTPPPLLLILSE